MKKRETLCGAEMEKQLASFENENQDYIKAEL